MSLFNEILKNIKKWAFYSTNIKKSQVVINESIIDKQKRIVNEISSLDAMIQKKILDLVNNSATILDEYQLNQLYDNILQVLSIYTGDDSYDWNGFVKKIEMAISYLSSQKQKEEQITQEKEKGMSVTGNIENIVYDYLKQNTMIDSNGRIVGPSPNIQPPPEEIRNNIIYFNKVVTDNSITEAVASQIILSVGRMLSGEEMSTDEPEYLQKQKKYENLPVHVRDRQGRSMAGDRVDSITGFTPQAKLFMDSTDLVDAMKRAIGGKKVGDDGEEAVHQTIQRFLGPDADIFSVGGSNILVDYKDGRILFFMDNTDYLMSFAENNGIDLDGEIRKSFQKTIDSSKQDLPLIDNKSNDVYQYLLNNYGGHLFEEISRLISGRDKKFFSWLVGKSRSRLSSILQKRQQQKSLVVDSDDGKSFERENKGKASDHVRDIKQESQIAKNYFYSVFDGMKNIAEKIKEYYRDNKDYVGEDMVSSMVEAAFSNLENTFKKNDTELSNILKKLPFDNLKSFEYFVKPRDVHRILTKKGEKRLQIKNDAEKMLKQGITIQDAARELKVDPEYLRNTVESPEDSIKSKYIGPTEDEVNVAMKEEGKKWLNMINYIAEHPELDPNPTMDASIDYKSPEVVAKIKEIKNKFGIKKVPGSLVNIESKAMFSVLSGTSRAQIADAKRTQINNSYFNDSYLKDYYTKIVHRFERSAFEKLGTDFIHWADILVEMAAKEAKEGNPLEGLHRKVFLNLMPIHSRFRSPSSKPSDAWAQKYVPMYFNILEENMPSQEQKISNTKEYMIFAIAMRAMNKIDSLSGVMNGMIKLSYCTNRDEISDEIDRIVLESKTSINMVK